MDIPAFIEKLLTMDNILYISLHCQEVGAFHVILTKL